MPTSLDYHFLTFITFPPLHVEPVKGPDILTDVVPGSHCRKHSNTQQLPPGKSGTLGTQYSWCYCYDGCWYWHCRSCSYWRCIDGKLLLSIERKLLVMFWFKCRDVWKVLHPKTLMCLDQKMAPGTHLLSQRNQLKASRENFQNEVSCPQF